MDSEFPHAPAQVFTFSREGVRALDEAASAEMGIPGIVLMENAAVALEAAAMRLISEHALQGALVLAGPGNNGGDGFALARRLQNRSIHVSVLLCFDASKAKGDALTNLRIIHNMNVPLGSFDAAAGDMALGRGPMLMVDALLGTGATEPPHGAIAEAIGWMRDRRAGAAHRILAVDIPSGLDCDRGAPTGPIVAPADVTVTLAGMKRGIANPAAAAWCGRICVGDIGVPLSLLRRFADG